MSFESCSTEQRHLPDPFTVLATQNPVEMEGTFPLPEAQLDRFLMKISVPAPDESALIEIFARTAEAKPPLPEAVLSREAVLSTIREVRSVAIAQPLMRQVARVVRATDPSSPSGTDSARRNLRLGASPRAGEAMCRAARVSALRDGRGFVTAKDLAWALKPVLRHRLLPSFEAEARGLTGDPLVADVLHDVPELPAEVEEILAQVDA